ncbi:hypothetical protein RF55_8023 [Lasius niger]|uniref:Uncharacterized protein n=1 Tax=Lasius niger TaxID=67767 RepID=A0A0J7KP63_LASNI|nr:hypothetical protein RF55_8023 [Lasius niger]
MAEPEAQIKEEAMSEFAGEVTTDTDATEDATTTIETGDTTKYASTDYESTEPDVNKDGEGKERSWLERCVEKGWSSQEGEPLWHVMKSYAESRREDKRRTPLSDVARLPSRAEDAAVEEILPPYECFPLGGFQLQYRAERTPIGLDRCRGTRIWRSMRTTRVFRRRGKIPRRTGSGKWPGVWPCVTRDELKTRREKEGRKKRRDVFPCDPRHDDDDEEESLLRPEQRSDFANRKELGHVRARVRCADSKLKLLVDRAIGERPGLVDGDYVIVEFDAPEGHDRRVYANVVLRGLKGMHLPELSPLRERRNTWKFCFYQAVVALCARTQLRYKYAWSANIDYIYDHAWTLYTHIGTINVKEKQRLDDVVVYNYKYDVEIELIQEMRDIPVVRNVDFNYEESGLRRQITLRRKDPLEVRVELGCEKMTSLGYVPVHEETRGLEEWFDKLAARYRDCIFRTARFSLAFWQDGLFWYLYNPYRCDELGCWNDDGRACIVKFCSKDSLRRHLMILLLRAYAYPEIPRSRDPDRSDVANDVAFDVQIFHVTFHRCQLHNLELLQRGVPETASRRRADEQRPSDSLLEIEETTDLGEDEEDDDPREPRERVAWLKRRRVTWGRCAPQARRKSRAKVARWHQYYVEEPGKLFSLWGEIHITDRMFDEANRGMQTYACYVVCAGMTRIMAPEYWSPKILDAIVACGDRYYARSKREAELRSDKTEYAHVGCWSRYLCDRFEIGGTLFEARMLPAVCGRLYARSVRECLRGTLERLFADHHFGVLTCENACLGVFKFCGAYYMCDVNSFGPPLFSYGRGAAYLMRATCLGEFVTVLVLTIASPERSRFTLNPVEILRIVEIGPAYESRARMDERRNRFGRFAGKREMRAFDERRKGRIKK